MTTHYKLNSPNIQCLTFLLNESLTKICIKRDIYYRELKESVTSIGIVALIDVILIENDVKDRFVSVERW
jgi:hypothetical protein